MDGIGKRVEELILKKGLTPYKVSSKTGVSQSTLSRIINKNTTPNESNMKALIKFFGVSETWLLTGKENQKKVIDNSPKLSDNKGVPYYDVDFHGGFDLVLNDQTINASYYIDFPPYNDCDAWINVTGKSMSPFISHGDIAALKRLKDWSKFIPFGEVYAVYTTEHRTIKIVSKGNDENHLTLIPYNKGREFVEQQIPKTIIREMFRVNGAIKKFF